MVCLKLPPHHELGTMNVGSRERVLFLTFPCFPKSPCPPTYLPITKKSPNLSSLTHQAQTTHQHSSPQTSLQPSQNVSKTYPRNSKYRSSKSTPAKTSHQHTIQSEGEEGRHTSLLVSAFEVKSFVHALKHFSTSPEYSFIKSFI
jgi:hypothetical protein